MLDYSNLLLKVSVASKFPSLLICGAILPEVKVHTNEIL